MLVLLLNPYGVHDHVRRTISDRSAFVRVADAIRVDHVRADHAADVVV